VIVNGDKFTVVIDVWIGMSASESESQSSSNSSRRSSYSSQSYHSDDKTEKPAKKKNVHQNKGTV